MIIPFRVFGGINSIDEPEGLVNRSHAQGEGGFSQRFPVESPLMLNIDKATDGIRKRKGSTVNISLDGLFAAASETNIVGATSFINLAGNEVEIAVGVKAIYLSVDGAAWARMQNSSAADYLHASDVSKCTFTEVDGHLFIGLDGTNNHIQAYKGATGDQADELDDHLNHNATSDTTVDASSSSGQAVLNVTATTDFVVNDRIVIDLAGTPEYGQILSIQAGVSLTLTANLGATYTTETVAINNIYENSYDSVTNVITGASWATGAYLVSNIHGRLAFSTGNPLAEYTPTDITTSSGIWDLAGSTAGFYAADNNILAMFGFVPDFDNSINQILYIATSQGMQAVTGFASTDTIFRIEGSKVIHGYQSYAAGRNWVYYLTRDNGIAAINGRRVIDVGRRLNSFDKDGVLDSMDDTAADTSFGFYNDDKRQAQFYYSDRGSSVTNQSVAVIDLSDGEPQLGEPQESYEKRIHLYHWKSTGHANTTPDTTTWFYGVYSLKTQALRGWQPSGEIYRLEQEDDDFADTLIDAVWTTPIFTANFEGRLKQWGLLKGRFDAQFSGDAQLDVEAFYDRDASLGKSFNFDLTNPVGNIDGGDSSSVSTDYDSLMVGGFSLVEVPITGVTLSTNDPVVISTSAVEHKVGELPYDSTTVINTSEYEQVNFSSVGGAVELNGLISPSDKTTSTTFTLVGSNSRNFTPWTSAGTVDTQAFTFDAGSATFVATQSGIGIGKTGISKDAEYLAKRSETIQLKFRNNTLAETFKMKNLSLSYTVGAEING